MSLRFTECFDGVSTYSQLVGGVTSEIGAKWYTSSLTFASITASGRTVQGLQRGSGTGATLQSEQLGNWGTEIYFGLGYKASGLPGTTREICRILDEDDGNTCNLILNSAGTIALKDGSATRVTSSTVLSAGTFYYLEVRFKMADAGGVLELKIGGLVEGTFAGDTKRLATSAGLERFSLLDPADGSSDVYDDIYVCDAVDSTVAGAPNNTYQGPVKIHCIRPDGNGNSSQFVGSDGDSSNNYQLVDEQATNDADYVQSTVDGDKDTYTFGDLSPLAGTIAGVCVNTRSAYLNGGDPKDLNAVARYSAVESEVLTDLSGTLRANTAIFQGDPSGAQWTEGSVNAAEFGYKQIDA